MLQSLESLCLQTWNSNPSYHVCWGQAWSAGIVVVSQLQGFFTMSERGSQRERVWFLDPWPTNPSGNESNRHSTLTSTAGVRSVMDVCQWRIRHSDALLCPNCPGNTPSLLHVRDGGMADAKGDRATSDSFPLAEFPYSRWNSSAGLSPLCTMSDGFKGLVLQKLMHMRNFAHLLHGHLSGEVDSQLAQTYPRAKNNSVTGVAWEVAQASCLHRYLPRHPGYILEWLVQAFPCAIQATWLFLVRLLKQS